MPSIVRYRPMAPAKSVYEAQTRQASDPKNTIVSVKRFMGRGRTSPTSSMPYDFVEAPAWCG